MIILLRMSIGFQDLKSIWKSLGIKGHVKNYSSTYLWVLETDRKRAVAHLLAPGKKSPIEVDADAFRRKDGRPIEGHASWWRFYDFSTAEVFGQTNELGVSVITKTAVPDLRFAKVTYDNSKSWGDPICLVTDVKRDKKEKNIISYFVTGTGWVEPDQFLVMVCHHKVDNARPVFPSGGRPYVRTRRDPELFNNIEVKDRA